MSDDLSFGETLRARRTALAENAPAFSLRQVAGRIGLEPSYLRKIERGEESPPGEQTIRRLAGELGENPDALLALAGKVSSDLLEIIRERPFVVAELLRALRCLAANSRWRLVNKVGGSSQSRQRGWEAPPTKTPHDQTRRRPPLVHLPGNRPATPRPRRAADRAHPPRVPASRGTHRFARGAGVATGISPTRRGGSGT